MNVRHLSELVGFSEDKLQKLSVFQTERLFLDVYCLRPGQAQKVHAHPGSDKVYLVLDGRCRFTVGAESAEHAQGAAVLAPAGVAHGVENASDDDARLLVVMSPPPEHARPQ
jgi:quercetin dioxygenase-like cupin family protein